jgi:hypothetical protein
MIFFDLFKNKNNNFFSQSGQDQFAYNLSGLGGFFLEIGAHHPVINSNTYKLETECEWKGISVEFDRSFIPDWENHPERKNKVIWDDAFNLDYSLLQKQRGTLKRINYLSCDIEPPENTFNILKKIIDAGLVFDFISFEHDKYNEGNKYDDLSYDFLSINDYKVAIKDVYSRNKKNKIYETWYVHKEISFEEINYKTWKEKFYRSNNFIL